MSIIVTEMSEEFMKSLSFYTHWSEMQIKDAYKTQSFSSVSFGILILQNEMIKNMINLCFRWLAASLFVGV